MPRHVPAFRKGQSLRALQEFTEKVYGIANDRLYSTSDCVTQLSRYTMRSLKGIRKHDRKKITYNLLVALPWALSLASRFHISVEEEVWKRFPNRCSYCGECPCVCKKNKLKKRKLHISHAGKSPASLAGFQQMFLAIYPPATRTLTDAGVHLAEETGEVAEAIANFFNRHEEEHFQAIRTELADYVSCVFGVANSAGFDMAAELTKLYRRGCHVCRRGPCVCTFETVIAERS